MRRLPLSTIDPHVRTSKGGSADSLQFYSTSYATSYGKEGFSPRRGQHSGAGYNSNLRSTVRYSPSLDRVDNPALCFLLQDNYSTITSKHFRPLERPKGKEALPWSLHQTDSGFRRSAGLSHPCSKAVKSVFVDTQDHGSETIAGIPGKHQPLLFQTQGKGSSELENCRHGPSFMSTEYKARFQEGPSCVPGRFREKKVGWKENTGFTEGSDLEPITYCPKSQYRQDLPIGDPSRPLGVSITKTDFLPSTSQRGNEFLPALSQRAMHDSGFTRDFDKWTKEKGAPESSVMKKTFKGLQRPSPTQTDILERVDCGKKELTGYSENNKMYVASATAPNHPEPYLTSYNLRFHDRTPLGLDREGWTRGGIQKIQPSSFSANNVSRKLGTCANSTETLRQLHPHVASTFKETDPFYDDHTHDRAFRPVHLIC